MSKFFSSFGGKNGRIFEENPCKCRFDLSMDCHNKDCLDCTLGTLGKIRAEIIQMPTISWNANDVYKADVLAIIGKYKAKIEE